MSQDIVADGLNQVMNANRIEKREFTIKRYSKVLLNLLRYALNNSVYTCIFSDSFIKLLLIFR